jgi:hypothetical protein
MALLQSRKEADCLLSHHTKQNLKSQPTLQPRNEAPYRASGLVHWPGGVIRRVADEVADCDVASLQVPCKKETVKWGSSGSTATIKLPLPSHAMP